MMENTNQSATVEIDQPELNHNQPKQPEIFEKKDEKVDLPLKTRIFLFLYLLFGHNLIVVMIGIFITTLLTQVTPILAIFSPIFAWSTGAISLIILFLILKPYLKAHWQIFREISFKKLIKYMVLIYLGMVFINALYSTALEAFGLQMKTNQNQLLVEQSLLNLGWAMVFQTVIVAPIVEELCVRMSIISRQKPWLTNIIAATIFAGLHFFASLKAFKMGDFSDLWSFPMYFTLGLGMGYMYLKTKTIFGAIALHMFNNLLAVIMLLVMSAV